MKRLAVLLACALALSACSWLRRAPAPAPVAKARPLLGSDGLPLAMVDGVPIERVPFRPGVSSATVEKMARAAQCTGGTGAGLVSEAGPVEVYKMACASGRSFVARCEYRQCAVIRQ